MTHYNPKNNPIQTAQTHAIGEVYSPVKAEVRDTQRQRQLYNLLPIIPFFDGGDASLDLFLKLRMFSSTHAAVIGSISDYVLGGGFTVEYGRRRGVAVRKDKKKEITDTEEEAYWQFIESFIDTGKLMTIAERLLDNYSTYGNAMLEIVLSNIAGTPFAKLHNHDADRCRYLSTDEGQQKMFWVSPLWSYDYLRRYDPELIPLYSPNNESSYLEIDGIKRTMIHLKNEVTGFNWYGLPPALASLYHQYGELQLGEYTTEGYANQFTGKMFFEAVGDPEDNEQVDKFKEAIERNYTYKGNRRSSIMARIVRDKDDYSKVHEFKTNTDEKFHDVMKDINEEQILKTHNWHHVLLGVKVAGSLGNSNEFAEVFKNKYKTKIKPLQNKILGVLNEAIREVAKHLGREDMMRYSLGLSNLFQDILDSEKELEQSKKA